MLSHMRAQHQDILDTIRDTRDLGDDVKKQLVDALDAFGKTFS